VSRGDYLLQSEDDQRADYVVGNPPYIRLEDVPDDRMAAYRRARPTMGGRADVYVGFYEAALQSLSPGGRLGFICADRWMRNPYGRRLRRLVTSRFSMDLALVMHDVHAFEDQVSAYPTITVISRRHQGEAVVADTTSVFGRAQAQEFADWYAQISFAADHHASFPGSAHATVVPRPGLLAGRLAGATGGSGGAHRALPAAGRPSHRHTRRDRHRHRRRQGLPHEGRHSCGEQPAAPHGDGS
jgi:hypothetical protein